MRALVPLEQHKLITVKPGADPLRITEKEVADNPRKLKFVPLEAAQLFARPDGWVAQPTGAARPALPDFDEFVARFG